MGGGMGEGRVHMQLPNGVIPYVQCGSSMAAMSVKRDHTDNTRSVQQPHGFSFFTTLEWLVSYYLVNWCFESSQPLGFRVATVFHVAAALLKRHQAFIHFSMFPIFAVTTAMNL